MASENPAPGPFGLKNLFFGNKQAIGSGSSHGSEQSAPGSVTPKPIKVPQRQDSLPEIVMTPSEIGLYETSHKHGNKGSLWERFFQNPGSLRATDSQPTAKS